jgi:hypothetical protein
MAAGEGVVVLVAHADRRIQPLGQRHAGGIAPPITTPAPFRITGKRALDSSSAASSMRVLAARGALELHDPRQVDVDHLVKKSRGTLICAGRDWRAGR